MDQITQTQMTNPPKDESKLIAPKKAAPRMIKIVALSDFMLDSGFERDENKNLVPVAGRMIKKGEIAEVPEAKARELLAKIEGAYAFSGERHIKDGDCKKHDLTRARLATKRDLVERDAPLTPLDATA